MKLTDIASLLAAEVQRGLQNSKAETAKEMKAMTKGLVADALGTGTPGYKALAELIEKEVAMRIPTAALFSPDKGKGYDPEKGFKGMSKDFADSLAKKTLFAISTDSIRARMFAGETAKAMGVGTGSSGGYLLPEEFVAEVARKLVHTSVFLGSCRVWSGVDMIGKMPRETGTVNVTIGPELTTPTQTQPTLGQLTWALQKRIELTNLPQELWKFSGVDVLNLLATMFAEQFQKTEDYYYLLGSGSNQPMGLLTQTTGMTSLPIAGAATVWQDLFALKHSVKSQYRVEKANCVYMANNATIELLATLTDDQNRPVFLDRGADGIGSANIPPQTVGFIAGHAVLENPYVPGPQCETLNGTSITSTATTSQVVFGNLERGYYAFKGPQMEVKTSDQAYDAFLNDGLYTRAIDFLDGKPAIPEAIAILTGVK